MRFPALFVFLPFAAYADPLMTAPEFDAATRGKTIVYGVTEGPYGAEQYLDNRRVRWSFLDGDCIEGEWYAEGSAICFVYEGDGLGPQCWHFRDEAGTITAEFLSDGEANGPLVALSTSQEPLFCRGPRVGV